jgi:hypothetical protein
MPRIKRELIGASPEYKMLCERSNELRENNDCTVVALAAVTGVDYAVAREALAAEGRRPGKGSFRHQQESALKKLGFKMRCQDYRHFIARYPGAHRNLRSVTTHHPDRFNKVWADGNNYWLYTTRHVSACVNGVLHDWARGRAKRVKFVYLIEKVQS